jgi:hypothetical protein
MRTRGAFWASSPLKLVLAAGVAGGRRGASVNRKAWCLRRCRSLGNTNLSQRNLLKSIVARK